MERDDLTPALGETREHRMRDPLDLGVAQCLSFDCPRSRVERAGDRDRPTRPAS
jgi:hypothetical protein